MAGGLAVVLLVALIGVLVGTFVYEVRLATRHRPVDPQRATVVGRAAAFTVLAYGFSWAWWIPLALDGTAIDFGQAAPRYVIGLVGPLVAALVVTAATDGGTAVRSPVARMVRWRVAPRWHRILVGSLLDLWLLAGEPIAYAYVDGQGLIGPLAGRDGAAAALALRAELARRASQPAEVLLPGTARCLVETALASRRRLTRPPGLLLLSGGADPPQALAISGYWLL